MYSYGSPHTAAQKQDDQHERTFSSCVRIQDVVLKTCLGRWTIGRSGERGSGISVLPARYDDDDDDETWIASQIGLLTSRVGWLWYAILNPHPPRFRVLLLQRLPTRTNEGDNDLNTLTISFPKLVTINLPAPQLASKFITNHHHHNNTNNTISCFRFLSFFLSFFLIPSFFLSFFLSYS